MTQLELQLEPEPLVYPDEIIETIILGERERLPKLDDEVVRNGQYYRILDRNLYMPFDGTIEVTLTLIRVYEWNS